MSMAHLGPSFDIHTGGVDLIFPHHEDEIAQSEAATGQPFVRTWLHCAHLQMGGEKMAKSTGNIARVGELLEAGVSPRALRYALIAVHYRAGLDYSDDSLAAAAAALERLDAARRGARGVPRGPAGRRRTLAGALGDGARRRSARRSTTTSTCRRRSPPCSTSCATSTAGSSARSMSTADAGAGARRAARPRPGARRPPDEDAELEPERRSAARRAGRGASRTDWAASDRLRDELADARRRRRGHARRPALATDREVDRG